jgi:VWFA-related protein
MLRRTILAQCLALPLPQDSKSFRISIDVDLVVLHATVRDRHGWIATGLEQADFDIFEDGVRQTIRLFQREELPVTIGLVIDQSGSMRHKVAEVVSAVRTFVQFSNQADRMFVVNFNEQATLALPPEAPSTIDPAALAKAIRSTAPHGMTALYDAIYLAREQFPTGTNDKTVLLVVSDGRDNASSHPLEQILQLAANSATLVYTIGIYDPGDPEADPAVLRRLARATGGEAYFPREPKDINDICQRLAKDIRAQYTLGYRSSNPVRNGAFRKLRVLAHSSRFGALTVHTRAGYAATGTTQ